MNNYSMSDLAICEQLGERIKTRRLEQNRNQQDVAQAAGLSRSAYQQMEKGRGTLLNFIAVLRVLNALDQLDNFLPDKPYSPIAMLQNAGRKRQRASSKPSLAESTTAQNNTEQDVDW